MTMSTTEDGANLDAATFDLDGWISEVVRPEVTVELYPYEVDFALRVAAIEAQIAAAEKTDPENRGLDDATAETLLLQMAELRAERSRTALKVRVRQLTDDETKTAYTAASDAGDENVRLWLLASACVEPTFTPSQLARLQARDRSGEGLVDQLIIAVATLMHGLPVPSSPAL
jgi:hypothetical protein